jgi:glycosyltransferase involved in cell wall biosynthesis
MRIAVDLVYFTGTKGGTETYARSLYTALGRLHPEIDLVGLVGTEARTVPPTWFPGDLVHLPVSGENRTAWALAENSLVPAAAWRARAEVLHCPANFGPVVSPVPVALTVHDLLAFRSPELVAGGARAVQLLTRTSVRGARAVLTDSEASAEDIHRYLGLAADRVRVVPLATAATVNRTTVTTDGTRPYLLSTGNRLPHKNFDTLLRALALVPAGERPRLVVPGSHGADPLRPLVAQLGLEDDVELRGWVTADELAQLYAGAAAYVLPSRFEGFGLPVLEAMARGCPVVCSDIPVLHEVGGGAAVYVDSLNAAALAGAVHRVLRDPALRADLSARGVERAALFSWDRAARATLAVLEGAARRPR